MSSIVVVALGGNALGNAPEEQISRIKEVAPHIIGLISKGYKVIITHGNGPQVGMINLAFDESSKTNNKIPGIGFPECAAMSQGYIGYHLQSGIQDEIDRKGISFKAVTVITRMEVDVNDPAFVNPVKPIGGYYTKEQIEKIAQKDSSFTYMEDAGRGYRRSIASPYPINIIEKDSILSLLKNEFVVIACGGGGIPVVKLDNGTYKGVNAVIDKDLASSKLAGIINADYLLILTAVDAVSLNWGKSDQKEIKRMSSDEAERYCKEGHFADGSMLPKVRAAIEFVRGDSKRKSIICSLEKADLALKGQSGTEIYM